MIFEVRLGVLGLKPTTTQRRMPLLIDVPGDLAKHRFLFPLGTILGEKDIFGIGECRAIEIFGKRQGFRVLVIDGYAFQPDSIPVIVTVLIIEASQPVELLALVRQPEFLRKLVLK